MVIRNPDLRLHHRGGEENLRCSHDRCDYRCFDRSSSLIRRRRLDLDGDSKSLEVGKVLDGSQQDGGLNKERSAQLLFDGGRVDNGKCTVGNVKDGSGNNKEVGVGVNDGFKDNASGSNLKRKMESQKEEQVGAPLLQDGKQESLKLQASNINGEAIKLPERLPQREEMQVGDIVVELGARKAVQSECGEGHVDPDVNRDIDLLINNITEGLEDAACIGVQSMREEEPLVKQNAGEPEKMLEQKSDSPRPGSINAEIYSNVRPSSQDQGVRHARPSVEETKLQNCDVLLCSSLWGSSFHGFSFRPSVGASGGILTLWDSSEVEMWWTESREHVLWCHGRFTKSGEEFFVANIYAPCDDLVKQQLWESISERLQSLAGKRVCVCGDFNAVKRVDERRSVRGGHRSLDHVPFSRFIEDNSLVDLPLIGRKFTWFKGDGCSMSRLDRFLLSEEWCLVWPNYRQVARLRGLSDHCPLVLSADEEDWGPRPSRMLKCWKDVPGYHSFVREKWNSFQVDGWAGHVLKEKFKLIKAGLKEWHRVHTHNLPSRIESLKARLAALDEKGEEEVLSEEELTEFHGVSLDIQSLSRMHASISWQQSRSLWLKDGDANSKYFHSVLASRGRRNAMSVVQVDGITIEGVEPIRQAVFSHFECHFKASNVDRPGVADLQFKSLNHVENGSLIKPFTEAEVKSAVWDCDSFKSPGPDGINFGFIKDFWVELRGDIMRFLSEFHRNGKLAKGINSTFIALIPKVDSPQRLNDFRPISLVGCLYKILAKVLANRLRLVIGSVISEAQTAFVKDRQILDGILVANEAVDEARKSRKELMLFKVDFEKAYDSVDWGYLDDIMRRMSFPTLWRKWIRECVCTATTSVLVNGSPTDDFPLRRGLRQGDPLSPFLFLLAAEGLNVLMDAMVARNLFQGYSFGEQGMVSVSHLQFADDTLLLGVKSWANVRALRAVLVLFETMSGLKVNFNKSMLVGVNISDSWLGEAASVLCCKVGKIPFLYLGLQIEGDPRRLSFWDPVLHRIKNRLSGWKSRFLSFGGRLVLLRSVLTSLPVYALSFFKAPSGIISSIESLFIKIFLGGGGVRILGKFLG
ncbi:unnamed protein product [Trifolium pratense]|uniref:Uncharacterized protein n=1 Tax=Trifolium pratense TaxID=57577 RepID=A0ACB0KZ62_TRIPR|nr:unnamed protein product [Trifolium pratense]